MQESTGNVIQGPMIDACFSRLHTDGWSRPATGTPTF